MKIENLQSKSHEVLLKLLNNIGVVGSIFLSVADIILVVIFTIGIKIDIDLATNVVFASLNAFIGVVMNVLLRYQGQKYAEIENKSLCELFYGVRIKTIKYVSMKTWQIRGAITDFLVKGGSSAFFIFGAIYISIEGSHNPIQILISLATLALFACFGLMNMNSAYERFYNVQVPYMKNYIKEKGEKENGFNQGRQDLQNNRGTSCPSDESAQRPACDE